MDRVRTEARRNRFRIGIVACLDIRSDDLLHARRCRDGSGSVLGHRLPRVYDLFSYYSTSLPPF
jgi:hypothetical protein